ncbi:MAG: CdaR family protein [Aridibacter sp.]
MIFSFPKEKFIEKEQRKIFVSHWLRRIFLDDWVMKLVAVIITVALWLGVTGLQAPTTTRLRNVTLNPLIANDLEITNSPVEEIDLVVTGDKRKVDQLNPRDLVVSLDLTDIQAGDRTIQITPQNITVELPSGVKIDDIQPDKIAIKLENVIQRRVPVSPETEGSVAKGFEIYNTTVMPAEIVVRGPKSSVEALNFVSTEKIPLKDRKNNFTEQQIPINISNPKITVVNMAAVSVNFKIGERRIERLFVIPYETKSRRGNASVLLFGPRSVLENLMADDLHIVEENSQNGAGKLRIILPDDVLVTTEIKGLKFRE